LSLGNTAYGKEKIRELLRDVKSIYFLGIGGINMSALARMTVAQGLRAGGYDRTRSGITEKLEKSGIEVFYELDPEHLSGYGALVYTVAISEDNPEYLRAQELQIPVISRADYMGYIMSGYRERIGISGMHGKSTTTAMVASVFEYGGADPTVLSGAELKGIESSYREGGLDNLVFEACEYKDSFLEFYPSVAIVLNIDLDHLDYFSGIGHIRSSFTKFINKCRDGGTVVLNFDDADVRAVASEYKGNLVTFGVDSGDVDYRAVNIEYCGRKCGFDLLFKNDFFCHIDLSVTGEHYVRDALAAAAAAASCGISKDGIIKGLSSFTGVHRRMEYRGKYFGADVFDDYAHHPKEIRSTFSAVEKMGYNNVWCIYQPHTYSRTATLYDDFISAFSDYKVNVIFSDIFAARETNKWGVSSEKLAEEIPGAKYYSDHEGIIGFLKSNVKDGDAVIVMGAGDICSILEEMKL